MYKDDEIVFSEKVDYKLTYIFQIKRSKMKAHWLGILFFGFWYFMSLAIPYFVNYVNKGHIMLDWITVLLRGIIMVGILFLLITFKLLWTVLIPHKITYDHSKLKMTNIKSDLKFLDKRIIKHFMVIKEVIISNNSKSRVQRIHYAVKVGTKGDDIRIWDGDRKSAVFLASRLAKLMKVQFIDASKEEKVSNVNKTISIPNNDHGKIPFRSNTIG